MCASAGACWVKKVWNPGAKYVRHVIRAAFSDMLQLISTHTQHTLFCAVCLHTHSQGLQQHSLLKSTKSAGTNFATVLHNDVYKIIKQFRDYCEPLRLVKGLRPVKPTYFPSSLCETAHCSNLVLHSAPFLFFFFPFCNSLIVCMCLWGRSVAEGDIPAPRWMPFMALH